MEILIGRTVVPRQGTVQGNGATSPMFVAISCTIVAYLESQVVGINAYSAMTLTLFTLVVILYVDDSDILIAAVEKDESTESISIRAQKAANAYRDGVHQTGGAVHPENVDGIQYNLNGWLVNGNMITVQRSTQQSIR